MKKKKIMTVGLVLALGTTGLVACSKSNNSSSNKNATTVSTVASSEKEKVEELDAEVQKGTWVTFTNKSGYIFNEVYLSPTSLDTWGEDLLGGTTILKSNGTHELEIPTASNGVYDVRAVDEDGDLWEFERIPLQNASTLVISGEDGTVTAIATTLDGETITVAGTMSGADTDWYDEDWYEGDWSDYDWSDYEESADYGWYEFTLSNYSSYAFVEAYFMEAGETEDAGYNHLEESQGLRVEGTTNIAVEGYFYHDIAFIDEDSDLLVFYGVDLEDAYAVDIEDGEETQLMTVHYNNYDSVTFEGHYE